MSNILAALACNLFEYEFGTLEKSYINPLIFQDKVRYSPKANNDVFMEREDIESYKFKGCYDVNSSYYNGVRSIFLAKCYLYMMDERILRTIQDGEIQVGEYFCDWYGEISCVFRKQWVSHIVVKELLRKGLLKKKDILKQHIK